MPETMTSIGWLLNLSIIINIFWYLKHKKNTTKIAFLKVFIFVLSIIILLTTLEHGILKLKIIESNFGSENFRKQNFDALQKAAREANENFNFFRTDPGSKEKRKGIKRIAVMGDSFVWGDGLASRDDIWSRQLARLIRESGSQTEVVDFGRNGWSTLDQFSFYQEHGIDFKPDLVIWGFVINDPDLGDDSMLMINDNIDTLFQIFFPYFRFFTNTKILFSNQIEQSLLRTKKFSNYGHGAWLDRKYNDKNLEKYSDLLMNIKCFLEVESTPFFFVSLPETPNKFKFEKKYLRIRQVMEKNGIDWLDLFPAISMAFGDMNPADWKFKLWSNPANSHPGKPVTSIFAREVFNFLEINHSEILHY